MATNTWILGTLYLQPHGPNGYWRQPGGPYTEVFPAQVVQPNSTIAPFSTAPVSEQTGVMSFPCGHFVDMPMIYRDIDVTTGKSVALVTCPQCSIIAQAISPYEAWANTTNGYAIVFP
jgi:hypothetical protein